jgi:hypothetical protein
VPLIQFCSESTSEKIFEKEFVEEANKRGVPLFTDKDTKISEDVKVAILKECFRVVVTKKCKCDKKSNCKCVFFLDKGDVKRVCEYFRKQRLTKIGILDLVPLNDSCTASRSFDKEEYSIRVLEDDETLYRIGKAGVELGQFFTKDEPKSLVSIRKSCAIKDNWTASGVTLHEVFSPSLDTVYTFTVPKGTVVFEGGAAPLSAFMEVDELARIAFSGGGEQIMIVAPWKGPKLSKSIKKSELEKGNFWTLLGLM